MPFTMNPLNPKFTFFSPVRTLPLDRRQLSDHVDRAIIALDRRAPLAGDCILEQLNAEKTPGELRVEIWVNDLDEYTCTYGFLVSSADGRIPFGRGERVVVNLDPQSQRPQKWSSQFVHDHQGLLKDLPAYG